MAEYSLPRRLLRSKTVVNIGLTSTQLLGPNPKRVAVVFSMPATNRYTIDFGQPAVLDQGFNMAPGVQPLRIMEEWYGQAIREEVTAISSGVAQQVAVLDIMAE